LCLASFTIAATSQPAWRWDYWADWGYKAKALFIDRNISEEFLKDPTLPHGDYPLLVPLIQCWLYFFLGRVDEQWVSWLYVGYGASLVGFASAFLYRRKGRFIALVWTPLLAGIVAANGMSLTGASLVGVAEIPLAFYLTTAVVLLAQGEEGATGRALAGFLMGMAAFTKNEGAMACGIAAFLLFLQEWKKGKRGKALGQEMLAFLIPIALFVLPWELVKAQYGLRTDLFMNFRWDVVLGGFHRLSVILPSLLSFLWDLRWAGVWLVWLAVLGRGRRSGFISGVLVLQLGVYVLMYYITFQDLLWHLGTSGLRLIFALTPLVVIEVAVSWSGGRLRSS
jgi:hypothetical protein